MKYEHKLPCVSGGIEDDGLCIREYTPGRDISGIDNDYFLLENGHTCGWLSGHHRADHIGFVDSIDAAILESYDAVHIHRNGRSDNVRGIYEVFQGIDSHASD
jgi:hypothetical protein